MKTAEATPQVRGGQHWPLSVAAYRALGEAGLIPKNTELLFGFVYKKVSKSPLHSFLTQFLHDALRQIPLPGMFVRTEQPITCEDFSEPEPDVAVVKGRKEDFKNDHPHTAELVIEVCVTSHDYDRSKLRAYATAGVKECWLVLGPEKQIKVHREPIERQFAQRTLSGPGGQLVSIAVPSFAMDL